MLCLHTARMPTVGVDLRVLAHDSDGLSPADLKALCQEAALAAMARASGDAGEEAVTQADFNEALRRFREGRAAHLAGV
jgi:ATP-dependent 26S proteasome regulatory subunit